MQSAMCCGKHPVVKRLTECVDLLLLGGKGKNMLRIRLLLPFCTKQELLHILDLGTPISAAFQPGMAACSC